jgi:hypothetical protein
MGMIRLPLEFHRLLSSLNSNKVEYLVVGGYAVIHHGYVRTTGDIDIWIAANPTNARKIEKAIRSLGFNPPWLKSELFLKPGSVLRIGEEPLKFEIINEIDGVNFADCYARRITTEVAGLPVDIISLDDLKVNKKASGRNKDLADLDYLPGDSSA